MKFFEHVLDVGTLNLEKVLFEFEKTPMLVVCRDTLDKAYLCLCTDVIIQETWMIAQVNHRILINLITDRIPILEAYRMSGKQILLGTRVQGTMQFQKYMFDELPEDELPDENEKLENQRLGSYLEVLYQREAEKYEKQFVTFAGAQCEANQYKVGEKQKKELYITMPLRESVSQVLPFGNMHWGLETFVDTYIGRRKEENPFSAYNIGKMQARRMLFSK